MAHSFTSLARTALTLLGLSVLGCGGEGPNETIVDAGLDCGSFCTQELAVCTAVNAQYASESECLTACATWLPGTAGAATGDTLACRTYHLGVAASSAANATDHCQHTSASGGGICQ